MLYVQLSVRVSYDDEYQFRFEFGAPSFHISLFRCFYDRKDIFLLHSFSWALSYGLDYPLMSFLMLLAHDCDASFIFEAFFGTHDSWFLLANILLFTRFPAHSCVIWHLFPITNLLLRLPCRSVFLICSPFRLRRFSWGASSHGHGTASPPRPGFWLEPWT